MNTIDYTNLFSKFSGREEDLRRITRYHIYKPMYYRSNLFTHSKRVLWLLQVVLPLIERSLDLDTNRLQLLAVVHDDAEIVMGDVMAGHKKKMSHEQLEDLERQEKAAITKMAKRFPYDIFKYRYEDLLREVQEMATLEAKVLKYFDRFDALGEALHEVFAGNQAFTTPGVHKDLGVIDLPIPFYIKYFQNFKENNPELLSLFNDFHPILTRPEMPKIINGLPHSSKSVYKKTGYEPYDTWREIILASGDKEEIENLYLQKEEA